MDKAREAEIITKVRGGDTSSYRLLVDAFGENIFSLVYKMTGSREDAEEIAQDVFVKGFFSLSGFRGESSFSTYLFRIAYNLSITFLRKKKREKVTSFEDIERKGFKGDPFDEEEDEKMDKQIRENRYEKLEKIVLLLPANERFLITAFYQQDKSLAELVEITGLSLSNVKVSLFRIRKKLALEMNKGKGYE